MAFRIIFFGISLFAINLAYGQVNWAVNAGINYTFSSSQDGNSVWNPDLGYQAGNTIEIQAKRISFVFSPSSTYNQIATEFLDQENQIKLLYFSLPFSIYFPVFEKLKIGLGAEKKILLFQIGPDPDIPLMNNTFKDIDQGVRVELDYLLLENLAINISGYIGLLYNGEQTDNFRPLQTSSLQTLKTHRMNSLILNLKYYLVKH